MVPKFLMGECHFPFSGRGNLGEGQVWGKVLQAREASEGDVKKAFGYMRLEIKGVGWKSTLESCQH